MKHFVSLIYFGIFLLLTSSCQKETFFEKETDFRQCHREQEWDSVSIENAIIGTWEYTYVQCYWSSEFTSENLGYDSMKIYANHTLELIDNDTIYETAQWHLSSVYRYLETEPENLFNGAMYFCQDRVVFTGSDTDLCDQYYRRID